MELQHSALNTAEEALTMFLDDLAPLKTEARGKVRSAGRFRALHGGWLGLLESRNERLTTAPQPPSPDRPRDVWLNG